MFRHSCPHFRDPAAGWKQRIAGNPSTAEPAEQKGLHGILRPKTNDCRCPLSTTGCTESLQLRHPPHPVKALDEVRLRIEVLEGSAGGDEAGQVGPIHQVARGLDNVVAGRTAATQIDLAIGVRLIASICGGVGWVTENTASELTSV